MTQINAIGENCPIPVVKTIKAIQKLNGAGVVETLVDNEIAVQNLTKMANQQGYQVKSEKLEEKKFQVTITVGEGAAVPQEQVEECLVTPSGNRKNTVVVIRSSLMGVGDEKLGATLLKSFIYALGQQEVLPKTILFYNGGVKVTCEESPALEDLKSMEAQGVEIISCGTCLDYYGLKDQLKVGEISNMYTIVEKLTQADLIVQP